MMTENDLRDMTNRAMEEALGSSAVSSNTPPRLPIGRDHPSCSMNIFGMISSTW